jgi:hypothetical protein
VSRDFKVALKNQQDILTFQGHLTQMIEGLTARSKLLSSIRNDMMVNDDSILTQLNWKSHPMKDFNKKMWITSSWITNYVLHPPICQEGMMDRTWAHQPTKCQLESTILIVICELFQIGVGRSIGGMLFCIVLHFCKVSFRLFPSMMGLGLWGVLFWWGHWVGKDPSNLVQGQLQHLSAK